MLIYQITNRLNGKCYVGKTLVSLNARWSAHCRGALSGRLDTHFARAIRKYGVGVFDRCVLEECKTHDELIEREILWIEKIDSFRSGYNSTTGGDGGTWGRKMSQASKDKLSKARMGLKFTDEHKRKLSESHMGLLVGAKNGMYGKCGPKNHLYGVERSVDVRKKISQGKQRKVIQLTLEGELVRVFDSLNEAASAVGGQHPNISKCCNGARNNAYGYCWRYHV